MLENVALRVGTQALKVNKSVVESKFVDKFDEIIEKHKEMGNPLELRAKEKLLKKINTTVSAIDKNITHIEDDLKQRVSRLPKPVRAFRGDISRVALSSKGELIALGIGTGTMPGTTQVNDISAVRPRIILKTLSGDQQMVQPELYYPQEIGDQPTVLDMKFSSDDRYLAAIVFHRGQSNNSHSWTLYAWQTADGKQIANLSIPILQMSEEYLQRLDLHRKYFQLAFDASEASVAIVTASGYLVTCRLSDCRTTKVERQLKLASARPQSGPLVEENTDPLGKNEFSLKYPHRLIALGTNEFGAIFAPETGIGLQLHKFKSSADVPETIKLMHTIELNEFSEQSEIELSTCANSSTFFAFNAAKKQVHAWVLDKDAGKPTICGRRFAHTEQNGDILHVYQTSNMPGAWRKADEGNENPQFSTYRTNLNSPDRYLGAYELPFTISQHSNDAFGNFVATLTATFSSGQFVKRVAVWRTQPGLHGAQNFASAACDRLYVLRPHFESSNQGRAKSPTPADCKPYLTQPIEEEVLQ